MSQQIKDAEKVIKETEAKHKVLKKFISHYTTLSEGVKLNYKFIGKLSAEEVEVKLQQMSNE